MSSCLNPIQMLMMIFIPIFLFIVAILVIKWLYRGFRDVKKNDVLPNIEPKCIVPDTMAIPDMLIAGEGVAILPKYLCQEALDKKQVNLLHGFDGDDERYLYFSCEQSVKNSVLVKNFYTFIEKLTC